jgi:hypothetical protein
MRLFIKRGDATTETFAGLIPLIEGDVLSLGQPARPPPPQRPGLDLRQPHLQH